jgi:hypothetical protein
MCNIIGPISTAGILTELYCDHGKQLIWNQRLQVLRDECRTFPLGWDKTIGWMDSRVKK